MKRTLMLLSLIGTLAAGNAGAVTITFDDQGFAALDDVTTQYAGLGVTFQGFLSSGAPVNVEAANNGLFADNTPPSAPTSLSNFYGHDKFNRAAIIRILFSTASSGISFQYDGAGSLGANTLFNIYSLGGLLLNSFSVAAAFDSNYHLVTVTDTGVGYIDIVAPQADWGHYLDNLTFTAGSSRAPDAASTSLLLTSSMALLIGLRRKLA